jgi:hypothetical protein
MKAVRTGMPVIYLNNPGDTRYGIVGTGRHILVKNTTNGSCEVIYAQVIKCYGDSAFFPIENLIPYSKPKTI